MKTEDLKTLLVDDDPSVLLTVEAMLLDIGITGVFKAEDGKKALDLMVANDCDVDLVVCDWNMPNKTGFEFLREIRMTHHELPFLMITARADKSSVQDAVDAGVTSYLRKPFSSEDMQRKIAAIFS